MKRIVPSSSTGMNSLPVRDQGIQVRINVTTAAPITGQRCPSTKVISGR